MKDIGFVAGLLFLIVLIAILLATPAVAAEKFKLEVGPNFVGHQTTFHYPDDVDSGYVSGTSFSGTGVNMSGSVKLSEIVNVGGRFDHNFLSNPTFFEIQRSGGKRNFPNGNERSGLSQRVEGFVGFKISGIGTLETGVARHSFGRHWVYCLQGSSCVSEAEELNNYHEAISWGPVIGLTREIKLGSFILGGGIWGYPRMNQGQEWSNDQGGTWRERSETASGIKLEVTGGYKLTSRTTVKGGYQFFRTFTPDPYTASTWRVDAVRAEHAVIARYVISF